MVAATLAEPIFEALSDGTITLDVAKAYASTENQEKQLLVWNSYGTSYSNADTIRRVIANETMNSTDPVAILVGEDRYAMTVTAGVAAIKGTYQGEVALTDMEKPSALTLRANGSAHSAAR